MGEAQGGSWGFKGRGWGPGRPCHGARVRDLRRDGRSSLRRGEGRGRRRGRQAGPAGQRRSARRGLSCADRWARGAGRERGAALCGCQVGQGGSGSTRQAASATRRVQAGLRHASRAEREGRAGRCGARLGRVESWAAHGREREPGPAGALGQGGKRGKGKWAGLRLVWVKGLGFLWVFPFLFLPHFYF